MPKHNIAIGITAGDNCLVHWVGMISAFQAMSGRDWSDYHFEMLPAHGLYIDLNRNRVVKSFLKTDCDYLLFIDHDNGFFPNNFDLLMEDMAMPEVKILSGAYYVKNPMKRVLVAGQKSRQSEVFVCDFYPEEAFASEGLKNITKDYSSDGGLVGAGFLMIKREVFDVMKMPYFSNGYHESISDRTGLNICLFLGEDNFFCMKAQKLGFDIYLDTRIKSPHMAFSSCFPPEWKQYEELS